MFDAGHDAHLHIVKQLFDPVEELRHIDSDSLRYRKGLDFSQKFLNDLKFLIVCFKAVVSFPRF